MGEERLLTLIQASDLHLGDRPQGSSQPTPELLALSGIFKGWLDHHFLAVSDFHDAWTDLVADREGEKVIFLLSGDLTANGGAGQFTLAADFLGTTPSANAFGMSLGLPGWAEHAILGNHDRWPGSYRIVGTPALDPNPHVRPDFPIVSGLIPLGPGRSLRIILVDSDADVHPLFWDRLVGRGRFETQMLKLDLRLPPVEDGEIRAMVIHHAVADGDVPVSAHPVPFPRRSLPTQWKKLKIEGYSLRELETRLVDAEISVVLTGHLHAPRLSEMSAVSGGRSRRVIEARCGTTTQQDDDALRARMAGSSRRPAVEPNTFLLHEILTREGRLVWATEVHWRSGHDGFKNVYGVHSRQGPTTFRREFLL